MKECRTRRTGFSDAHRALHDVGQVAASGSHASSAWLALSMDDAAGRRIEHRAAADDAQRRTDGAGDRLDQRRFAAARFAGQAVDFVGVDMQADIVHGAHLARDAERMTR